VNPQICAKLDEVRAILEALGVPSDHHASGKPGIGQADNISDANDAIDKYLATAVDMLVAEAGMDEDTAFERLFAVAEKAAKDGELPALPDDKADPEELAMWLGKATTWGLAARVLSAARGA
jgi:hypothetical protein